MNARLPALVVLAMWSLLQSCTAGLPCEQLQCVRSFACRTSCTAPVTLNGCCSCPAGTFDDVGICLPDGGQADGGP